MKIDPLLIRKATGVTTPPAPKQEVTVTVPAQVPAVTTPAAKAPLKSPLKGLVMRPQSVVTPPSPKAIVRVDPMVTPLEAPEAPARGPLNFQERLDELDRLITVGTGITMINVDTIRGHVMQIMIDLKQQPELDSCLIDRDVHNILKFVRHTHVAAAQEIESTAKKKVVKNVKDTKKRAMLSMDFDMEGPDSMLSITSLEQLGDME